MLQCQVYHPSTKTYEDVAPERVPDFLRMPDTLLWVDLQYPVDEPDHIELSWLADTFQFHPLAMEDVRNQRQRSKVDTYEDYFFMVIRHLDYQPAEHSVDSHQLDIFIGANFLVTVHQVEIPALEVARHRWKDARLTQEALPFLCYLVVDAIVDNYFPVLDQIGEEIDDIDEQTLGYPDRTVIGNIFTLRKALLNIRKILGPLRDALNELIRSEEDGEVLSFDKTRAYFADVYDHVLRLTDFVDTYRDMLSGSLDAYQSSLSNRLNENMQRLTVAATILATATVVTGFYGMNLHGLGINAPTENGGIIVLLVLVITTLIELLLFRRIGWI